MALTLEDVFYPDVQLDVDGGVIVLEVDMAIDETGQLLEDPMEAAFLICNDGEDFYEVDCKTMTWMCFTYQ